MTPQHAAALEYAQRGWHVFPLAPNSKLPLIPKSEGGQAHLDATTNPEQINAWWSACPNANVGVSLAPSGLYVLDVDLSVKKDGTQKKGRETLAKIDHELTDTLTALTPRGGLHGIYQRPPDLEPHRHINIIEKDSGLDLLGEGYIVVAPSVFVDKTTGERGEYRWHRLAPVAPMPPVLRTIATTAREKVQLPSSEVGSALGEGGRNLAMFRLGCALRAQGLGADALAAALYKENQARCKPPLPDGELGTILEHVLQQVTPQRDAAVGAVVEQVVAELHAPVSKAVRVGDFRPQNLTPQRFYPTAFPKLNELIGGGLATRHHLGIIGPPACGKSGFINELVLAQQQHTPVLIYSAELPIEEVRVRLAAAIREFAWRDGVRGAIQADAINTAVQNLGVWIIGADDIDRESPLDQIYYEAEQIKNATGAYPAVFEDYVQLLADGSEDKVRHKVGQLSKGFRIMSQRLDVPVVAIYSTSRTYYGGQALEKIRKANDPTAYLAAAKECGDIEYHCATLLYLDLDKLYEGAAKPARIAVSRARVGDVGFVGARAHLDIGRWRADDSALAEMSAESITSRTNDQKLDRDCDRLLEVMKRLEGRAWREIKMASGLGFAAADAARSRLIDSKRVRLETVEGYDKLHRKQKREILVVCDDVPEQSEDV